jgi:hypothetical protein
MGAEWDDYEIPMGSVCMDRAGNIGVVSHVNQSCSANRCGLTTYFGRTLDGGHWQTSIPTKLADTLDEYAAQQASREFTDPEGK